MFEHNDFNTSNSKQSQSTSSENLLLEAHTRQPLIVARDLIQPAISGLTARAAYLALTGQLHVDKNSMSRAIASSDSPVAGQILNTMSKLEADNWRFVKGPTNMAGGGIYDPSPRSIWFSTHGWKGELRCILGAASSPVKRGAVLLSHEVGHYDTNIVVYGVDPADSEAASVMVKRHLIAETRAMLTEVHIAQQLGVSIPQREAALRSGTLAEHIIDTHPAAAGLPLDEGNRIVNDYLEKTYGKNLINPVTGRVRPFDMYTRLGQNQVAPLQLDAEFIAELEKPNNYMAYRQEPLFELRTGHPFLINMMEKASSTPVGESNVASIVGHGTRALAAVGLLLAANDIVGQYHQSFGSGNGRLARVATDWAGYELGAKVASSALSELAMRNPYVATAFVFGTAMVASSALDTVIGRRLEQKLREL